MKALWTLLDFGCHSARARNIIGTDTIIASPYPYINWLMSLFAPRSISRLMITPLGFMLFVMARVLGRRHIEVDIQKCKLVLDTGLSLKDWLRRTMEDDSFGRKDL